MDHTTVERHRHLEPPQVAEIARLVERVAGPGPRPLADHKWLQLGAGGGEGFVALVARDGRGGLVGYGQLSAGNASWGLEVLAEPSLPDHGSAVKADLVAEACRQVAAQGGGRLFYWVGSPTPADDARARAQGFDTGRDLLQMRVPLPLDEAVVAATPVVEVRAFRPGEDEAAWLAVNNRAFAGHPEQGGWGLDDLVVRERADWFEPAGFLLHEEDGQLAGSCWTKIHATVTPVLGEIYVISVDPAFHQRGLGRALAVAGFSWLAGRGITVGMLYVDADNRAAMALYEGLGMTVHHRDRAYQADIPAG